MRKVSISTGRAALCQATLLTQTAFNSRDLVRLCYLKSGRPTQLCGLRRPVEIWLT